MNSNKLGAYCAFIVLYSVSASAFPMSDLERDSSNVEVHTTSFVTEAPPIDPITIGTIGGLFLGLQAVISDLATQVRNAAGELRTQGEGLISSANAVATTLEQKFRGDMDRGFEQLNKTEKRFFNDAKQLIIQMQSATTLIASQSYEQAKELLIRGDIAAYNATAILQKYHIPRVVYIKSKRIRLDTDDLSVTVFGNFFDIKKAYDIEFTNKDGGIERIVPTIDAMSLTFQIPEAHVDLGQERSYLIRFRPFGSKNRLLCKPKVFESEWIHFEVTIVPRTSFNVFYDITPKVKFPVFQTFSTTFYNYSDDCKINADFTNGESLPIGWEFADPADPIEIANKEHAVGDRIIVTTANCGTDMINRPSKSGDNRVTVTYRLKGCGPEFLWFGCAGRGWIGYTLILNGAKRRPEQLTWTDLQTYSGKASSIAPGQTKRFPYVGTPPAGYNPVETDWAWSATVFATVAGKEVKLEISKDSPSHSDPSARVRVVGNFLDADGKLEILFELIP